jgi:hypothetical protein
LGTATAHCNHVGQSSIFVMLLFRPPLLVTWLAFAGYGEMPL